MLTPQICINQNDTWERNHQVGLMSRIYNDAREVIIWLGAGKYCGLCSSPYCPCNEALLKDPYWSRLWIIQEVVLARERVIWFDTYSRRWKDLLKGFVLRQQEIPHAFWKLTQWSKENFPFDLAELLELASQSQCQDPRDIFYGIQSLIAENQRQIIDYAMSAQQVFDEGAIMASKSKETLTVLSALSRISKRMLPTDF